jgi:DNA-binding NtrC family response regulator
MSEAENCILLVDDEVQVVNALRRALLDEDYEILSAQGGTEALKILATRTIKVIVCDERMPGMSGAELLSIVNRRHSDTVRILLTGQATTEGAMKAVNEGEVCRYFSKPWNDLELKLAIRAAIEKYDQQMKVRRLMALVRTQHLKLKQLEQAISGIQAPGRAEDGSYFMPELSDLEIAEILKECRID